jgi:hypothetical protein
LQHEFAHPKVSEDEGLSSSGAITLNLAVGIGKLGSKKLKFKAKQIRTFYPKW